MLDSMYWPMGTLLFALEYSWGACKPYWSCNSFGEEIRKPERKYLDCKSIVEGGWRIFQRWKMWKGIGQGCWHTRKYSRAFLLENLNNADGDLYVTTWGVEVNSRDRLLYKNEIYSQWWKRNKEEKTISIDNVEAKWVTQLLKDVHPNGWHNRHLEHGMPK